MLSFGGPRNEVVTKINTETRSRPTSMRTSGIIGIRVRHQEISRRRLDKETMRQRTMKVTKDTFQSKEVRFTGIMHEKTYLLNSICYIRTSESEILKCSSKALIES